MKKTAPSSIIAAVMHISPNAIHIFAESLMKFINLHCDFFVFSAKYKTPAADAYKIPIYGKFHEKSLGDLTNNGGTTNKPRTDEKIIILIKKECVFMRYMILLKNFDF